MKLLAPLSLLSSSLILVACGGGGSDEAPGAGAPAAASPSAPATAPAPATTPPTTPPTTPTPTPSPSPAPSTPAPPPPVTAPAPPPAETPPSNSAPQPGSTTAVGNGVEGLWVSASGDALAFVDAAGNYLGFDTASFLLQGSLSLSGTNWRFVTPTSVLSNTSDSLPFSMGLIGNGTVTLRSQFQGLYGPDFGVANRPLSLAYEAANALAASQADVVGRWSAAGMALDVGAAGAVTGTTSSTGLGRCVLNGTLTHAEPATRKNRYVLTFTASSAAGGTCLLDTARTYQGVAAMTFANVGTAQAPAHVRALTFMVRTPGASWTAAQLVRIGG